MKCLGLLLVLACLCAHYKKVSGRYPEGCLYERGVLKCMHAGLTQLPPSLPLDASEIDLQHNDFEEVYAGYFEKFSRLNRLLLGNNHIFSIEDGSFDGLPNLKHLELRRNELTSLHPNHFKGMRNLEILDLSYNFIETIAIDSFEDLSSIRKINLYGNALTCTCELNWMVKLAQEGILDPVPFCTDLNDSFNKSILILQQYCQKPTIRVRPKDIEVKREEDAAFECVAQAQPTPVIKWLKNSAPLVESERMFTLNDGSLIIKQVTDIDVGTYKCIAMNEIGEMMSKNARLTIVDFSHPTLPVIVQKPLDKSVVENEGTTFKCSSTGYPAPTVDWQFNGRSVSIDPRFVIKSDGTLVMERLKAIDAGLYKCVASNRLGSVHEFARLEVFNAPIFSTIPKDQRVVQGHAAFFSCDASAEPPAKIYWKKDEQDLINSDKVSINPSGTTLALHSVDRFDEGLYTCIAENLGGLAQVSATLSVIASSFPKIAMISSDVVTYLGNSIQLLCKVEEGDPTPVTKWKRKNEALFLTTNIKYEVDTDGTLVIRDLEYSDEGVYTCYAENSEGIVQDDVTVTVKDSRFFPIDDEFIGSTVQTVQAQVGNAESITRNDIYRARHSPTNGHELLRNNRYPPIRALPLSRAAEVFERTIEQLIREVHSGTYYNITFEKSLKYQELLTPNQLILLSSLSGCTEHRLLVYTCDDLCFHQNFRTFDGTCNNFERPMLGSSMSPLMRLVPPRYENNFNLPIGWSDSRKLNGFKVPSTRKISLELLSTPTVTTNEDLSNMLMQWGQFLDHDMSFSPTAISNARFSDGRFCNETCNSQSPCFPIPVDNNDPRVTEHRCIGFVRSSAMCGSGITSKLFMEEAIHRQQVNIITSFIDASNVYGSSEEEASNLRNHNTDQGLLRVGVPSMYNKKRKLLPPNQGEFVDCQVNPNTAHVPCFQSGDHRTNEQLGLLSMHTLWFREHNRLARLLKRMNSHWDGDQTYHQTRKIIGAMMQHITYEHWLPEILGPAGMAKLGEYQGYDPSVDPSIANAFSTAAFRFGHTLINPIMPRLNSSFLPIKEGNLLLHKAFFAPFRIVEEGGIDPVIRGLFATGCKLAKPGEFLNEELTERLFTLAHEVALDLAAFNVQRGRDHGLGSYNAYRTFCGLRKAESFDDLSREITSQMVRNKLQSIYGHPDNIDLFVGGLSETPLPGAQVGETFSCIIANQFKRLREGDRFWYKKPGMFSKEQLMEIEKSSLARLICDNSDGITQVQNNVFRLVKDKSEYKECSSDSIPFIDVRPWSQCCESCSRSGDFSSSRTKRSVETFEQKKEQKPNNEKNSAAKQQKRNEGSYGTDEDIEARFRSLEASLSSINLILAELQKSMKERNSNL